MVHVSYVKKRLSEKIPYPSARDMMYCYNKVKPHSRFETFAHFIVKAGISFLYFRKGRPFLTEYETVDGRKFDVVIAPTNSREDIIIYKIVHTHREKDYGKVMELEINVRKAPKEVKQAIKTLRNWLKKFMVKV